MREIQRKIETDRERKGATGKNERYIERQRDTEKGREMQRKKERYRERK